MRVSAGEEGGGVVIMRVSTLGTLGRREREWSL